MKDLANKIHFLEDTSFLKELDNQENTFY